MPSPGGGAHTAHARARPGPAHGHELEHRSGRRAAPAAGRPPRRRAARGRPGRSRRARPRARAPWVIERWMRGEPLEQVLALLERVEQALVQLRLGLRLVALAALLGGEPEQPQRQAEHVRHPAREVDLVGGELARALRANTSRDGVSASTVIASAGRSSRPGAISRAVRPSAMSASARLEHRVAPEADRRTTSPRAAARPPRRPAPRPRARPPRGSPCARPRRTRPSRGSRSAAGSTSCRPAGRAAVHVPRLR